MTDFQEFFESDDGYVSDPSSPFYGLPFGEVQTERDANEEILEDVLDRLGVSDFAGIFVDFDEANVENLRGNRFANLTDALVYLAEAGILQFGRVVLDDDGDIVPEIDDDTGKSSE